MRRLESRESINIDEIPRKHPLYPIEDRKRNELCERLLDVIKDSVVTFKPSQSLSCLQSIETTSTFSTSYVSPSRTNAVSIKEPIAEIDVVVSGGGLKGYFMTGCSHILMSELTKQNIRISRVAGASAGAWVGLFMLTNFGTENWLETYYKCKERPGMFMHDAYDDIWPWVNSCMPDNAWEICSGRLFISITEVTLLGFKNHIISEFTSNRDLFDACLASSTVPFISLSTAMRKYRGMWVVDGGLTNNTPVFTDNLHRQLVFRLSDVFYPGKLLINPHDYCIESLVVRGAILMSRFLQGQPVDSFAWVYPKVNPEEDGSKSAAIIAKFSDVLCRYFFMVTSSVTIIGGAFYLMNSQQRVSALRKFLSSTKIFLLNKL